MKTAEKGTLRGRFRILQTQLMYTVAEAMIPWLRASTLLLLVFQNWATLVLLSQHPIVLYFTLSTRC